MKYEEQYYKLTEYELKTLLKYKEFYEKQTCYQSINPCDWEYAENFNIEEELKNYKKLPCNNKKVVAIRYLN